MAMNSLSHPTMGDVREDEEKWFKFFTKRSLLACLIGIVPGYLLFSVAGMFLPTMAAGAVWLAVEVFLFIITTVRLSVEDKRNKGGGQFLYMVMLRKLIRRFSRTYYIKMNTEGEEEDDET